MCFRKGLDKNIGSAHFWSQRMQQNAGFCIKIYKKKSGDRDSRTPAAGGETVFAPAAVPTRRMLVLLRFFWAGYSPACILSCLKNGSLLFLR